MKVSKSYSNSLTSRVLNFLFGPKNYFSLAESRLFKVLSKIENLVFAEASVLVALFFILYKGLLLQLTTFNFGPFVLIFLVLALIFCPKGKLFFNKSLFWLLGFLAVTLVSGFLAVIHGLSSKMILLGLLIFVQFILAVVAGQGLGVKKVNLAIVSFSIPAAFYGIWQFFTNSAASSLWFSSFENLNSTRALAWFGTPNVFGAVMAMVGTISLFEFLVAPKKKYFFGIAFAVSVLALFASLSRSAWIAFAIGTGVAIIVWHWKYIFFAPFLLLVLAVNKVRSRLLALFNPKYLVDSGLDGRIWTAKNGLYIWAQKPLFGFGPGSYGGQIAQNYTSPVYLLGLQNGYTPIYFTDNQWLELLVQGGVLGVFSMFGFFISTSWQILANYRSQKNLLFLGSFAVILIFVVTGFTGNVLEFGAVAIPAGLVIGGALSEG